MVTSDSKRCYKKMTEHGVTACESTAMLKGAREDLSEKNQYTDLK